MAPWAKAELRKKAREERRIGFFSHVRVIFVLLFVATILVFATRNETGIQQMASAGLNHALKKPAMLSDRMRDKALNHEKEIDNINQQPAKQP